MLDLVDTSICIRKIEKVWTTMNHGKGKHSHTVAGAGIRIADIAFNFEVLRQLGSVGDKGSNSVVDVSACLPCKQSNRMLVKGNISTQEVASIFHRAAYHDRSGCQLV